MENRMEEVSSRAKMELKKLEYGAMVKRLDGFSDF